MGIASLVVWPLVGAQFFSLFPGIVTAHNDDETETKPVFGYISLSQKDVLASERKYILKLAEIMTYLTVSMFYILFELWGYGNLFFIASIPLKSLFLRSGSHLVSCFSGRAEISFRLQGICPSWIILHLIANLIPWEFVSEAGLTS